MGAKSRYWNLRTEREQFVSRSRKVAALTIPSQFIGDYDDSNGNTQSDRGELPDPYQSVGARGVRNLSSRFQMTLLPTNEPFFKYSLTEDVIQQAVEESGGAITRGNVEQAASKLNRTIHSLLEETNLRVESPEIFTSLVIDGNPLIYVGKDLKFYTYRLDQFVMKRDRAGRIAELIVRETFLKETLPDFMQTYLSEVENTQEKVDCKSIDIYTVVTLGMNGKYSSHQEMEDKIIEESKTEYPKGILPWIAPRIIKLAGEHYGRSYMEETLGDLRSLEGLSKALVEMSAASSRIIFLVSPQSTTSVRELGKTPNGGFIIGNPNDINPLQAKLQGDFQVVGLQATAIEQRLSQSFLLASSIQRNAERVTAEEIRLMSNELDNALGGLYSVLAAEFQKPLIEAFQWRLKQTGVITVPDAFKTSIVTGSAALGRGQDINKLNGFISNIAQLAQAVPGLNNFIKPQELINRLAAAHGIDENNLLKSPEDIAEEQQAQQMQEQLQSGPAGKALAAYATNQLSNGEPNGNQQQA